MKKLLGFVVLGLILSWNAYAKNLNLILDCKNPKMDYYNVFIHIKNNKAFIEGVKKLVAAPLISSDLRGSIALVLAATAAEGVSKVDRVYHAYRGAENFVNKLKKIGVKIKVLK